MNNEGLDVEVKEGHETPTNQHEDLLNAKQDVQQQGHIVNDNFGGDDSESTSDGNQFQNGDGRLNETLNKDIKGISDSGVNGTDLPNDKYEPMKTDGTEQFKADGSKTEKMETNINSNNLADINDDDIPTLADISNMSPDDLKEGDVEDECMKQNGQSDKDVELSKEEDEWLDVLGSGQLKRKVLKTGNGVRAVSGDTVTVSSVGKLEDGTEIDKEEAFTFTLGDGDVIAAWDLSVSLMEVGEIAEVVTEARFAYGELGRDPDIPKDATITYTLELLKKDYPIDLSKLSLEERMEVGEKKRERGNYYFSRMDHTSAMNSYNKALRILELESFSEAGTSDVSKLQEVLDSRVKCFNNLAACQLKVEAYDMVIKSCKEVLNIQPKNVKALFRMGKAYAGKGSTREAIDVLKKALQLEPETKIIHQELSKLTQKRKVETQSERNMYRKMLGTKETNTQKQKPTSNNIKWLGIAGAVTAILVSVGLAAYKFSHS